MLYTNATIYMNVRLCPKENKLGPPYLFNKHLTPSIQNVSHHIINNIYVYCYYNSSSSSSGSTKRLGMANTYGLAKSII